jgi:hypothetical protein
MYLKNKDDMGKEYHIGQTGASIRFIGGAYNFLLK